MLRSAGRLLTLGPLRAVLGVVAAVAASPATAPAQAPAERLLAAGTVDSVIADGGLVSWVARDATEGQARVLLAGGAALPLPADAHGASFGRDRRGRTVLTLLRCGTVDARNRRDCVLEQRRPPTQPGSQVLLRFEGTQRAIFAVSLRRGLLLARSKGLAESPVVEGRFGYWVTKVADESVYGVSTPSTRLDLGDPTAEPRTFSPALPVRSLAVDGGRLIYADEANRGVHEAVAPRWREGDAGLPTLLRGTRREHTSTRPPLAPGSPSRTPRRSGRSSTPASAARACPGT